MGDDIELSFDDTFEDPCVDSDHAPSRSNSIKGKKGGLDTNSQAQSDSEASTGAQETIPTAIVIKNIPFSIKRDALLETLNNLDIPRPYAFNYHFDNGVFRGLAFANYRTPEETDQVVSALNGYEVSGRKLRVEYKRVLPAAEREAKEREKLEKHKTEKEKNEDVRVQEKNEYEQIDNLKTEKNENGKHDKDKKSLSEQKISDSLDLNDPDTLKFYDQVIIFRDDKSREELVFQKTLTSAQRRTLHLIAQKVGLYHYSEGDGDERVLKIVRKPASAAINIKQPKNGSFGRRTASQLLANAAGLSESPSNRSYRGDASPLSRSPFRKSWLNDGTPIVFPIRQPRGPDPAQNFASRSSPLHTSAIEFEID
ncbi:1526_t:CDS:2 [Entrophospora sp. SA101]|nr:9064_t:CDS:2 [Entrophospora sp. SA101]CAJ0755470.1 1526_t:CDS:2 [Entrophospora sp. SA101]CAJ0904452.1 11962_t:CDS:2 [Entrophospora sp. SA101]